MKTLTLLLLLTLPLAAKTKVAIALRPSAKPSYVLAEPFTASVFVVKQLSGATLVSKEVIQCEERHTDAGKVTIDGEEVMLTKTLLDCGDRGKFEVRGFVVAPDGK